jgi:Na+/proline symporter
MLVPRVVDAVVLSVLVSHAAIFVPLLAALYLRRVPARAGTWAILLGAAGGLVAHFFAYERWPVVGMIHPLFVGPILASAALLAGWSWRSVERRPDASEGSQP